MNKEVLAGGCLCGAVVYQVTPTFLQFVHCHCSRCRKATGTGHATNIYVEAACFNWVSGENQISRFDLPTARSFATVFCNTCGSPLPHHTRNGKFVVIPAGSIDSTLTIRPGARIFWDSRAEWESCDEILPKFSERPEQWP